MYGRMTLPVASDKTSHSDACKHPPRAARTAFRFCEPLLFASKSCQSHRHNSTCFSIQKKTKRTHVSLPRMHCSYLTTCRAQVVVVFLADLLHDLCTRGLREIVTVHTAMSSWYDHGSLHASYMYYLPSHMDTCRTRLV
jgi:hypothetical protein